MVSETVDIVVQVNGKLRGKITVPKAAAEDDAFAAATAIPAIAKFVTGAPKKVIYVPGRLLNIVV
jgi:leucyl-tRNA synthetase